MGPDTWLANPWRTALTWLRGRWRNRRDWNNHHPLDEETP